jgi:hypothetical protein
MPISTSCNQFIADQPIAEHCLKQYLRTRIWSQTDSFAYGFKDKLSADESVTNLAEASTEEERLVLIC